MQPPISSDLEMTIPALTNLRNVFLTVLFAFVLVPTSAHAEDGGAFFEGLSKTTQSISARISTDAIQAMTATGISLGASLQGKALALGGALALLYLVVRVLQSLGTNDSMLQIIFDVALPTMIAAALINTYGARVTDLIQQLEVLKVVDINPLQNVLVYFAKALDMVSNAVRTAFGKMGVIDSIMSGEFPGAKILDFLATVLVAILVFGILLLAIAEIAGIVLLGPFLFAIGLAFGPIFIATMVTPWTKEYFGKWIGFMVAAALVSAVAGVAVTIAGTLFTQMFANISTDVPVAASLGVVAIMLVAVNSVLSQVPSIASAMVPGTLGNVGGGAGKQLADGAKAVGNSAKAGGKGAVSGTKLGYKLISKLKTGGAAPTP